MDLLLALIIIVALVVLVRWWRGRENFINYYGYDDNILDKVCPSPWCGGETVPREPEVAMYPFIVAGDGLEVDKKASAIAMKRMQEMNSEAHQVAQMAGYNLEDDYLVNPSNNVKEVLMDWEKKQTADALKMPAKKGAAYGLAQKERFDDYAALLEMPGNHISGNEIYALYENNVLGDGRLDGTDGGDRLSSRVVGFNGSVGNGYTGGFTGGEDPLGGDIGDGGGVFSDNFREVMKYGTHRTPSHPVREGFEAQQNVENYSYAARQIYDHPDMDNFNRTYYSNPSRTLGIAPQQQAIMHFNEGVGYYARPQEMLEPSSAAVPDIDEGISYGRAIDFFDLPETFSGALVEDPREAVTMPDGMYKGRRDINDVLDTEMRRRNQITLDAGQRGGRYSNKARAILSTVFSPEMYDATQNVWWAAREA